MIRERVTGRFIGEVGAAYQRRNALPALGDDPEVGWALMPEAQGCGFASEALVAVLAAIDRDPARRWSATLFSASSKGAVNAGEDR